MRSSLFTPDKTQTLLILCFILLQPSWYSLTLGQCLKQAEVVNSKACVPASKLADCNTIYHLCRQPHIGLALYCTLLALIIQIYTSCMTNILIPALVYKFYDVCQCIESLHEKFMIIDELLLPASKLADCNHIYHLCRQLHIGLALYCTLIALIIKIYTSCMTNISTPALVYKFYDECQCIESLHDKSMIIDELLLL